jgi:hypothetical protein
MSTTFFGDRRDGPLVQQHVDSWCWNQANA